MKKYRELIFKYSSERRTLYYILKQVKGIGFYHSKRILIRLGFPIHHLKTRVRELTTTYKWKLYHAIMTELESFSPPKEALPTGQKSYKDYREIFHLPRRGQRTRTNASTTKIGRVIAKPVEKKMPKVKAKKKAKAKTKKKAKKK